MNKIYAVIAYDIPEDKRRTKVAKTLEGYGERMQYSLFECRLDKVRYLQLRSRIEGLIEPEEDEVSFYFLCEADVKRIVRLGRRRLLPDTAIFVGWDNQFFDK